MNHDAAMEIAQGIWARLKPTCSRIEIGGSLRRGKPDVKDIEIVAMPDLSQKIPLTFVRTFGQKIYPTRFDELVGKLDKNYVLIKGGQRYRQYKIWLADLASINLDLFIVRPPAQWGVQFVIRTGPNKAENNFSQWCVTPRSKGGALPNGYCVSAGGVYPCDAERKPTGDLIPMPEEIDFLEFLGLGWIVPAMREARWQK